MRNDVAVVPPAARVLLRSVQVLLFEIVPAARLAAKLSAELRTANACGPVLVLRVPKVTSETVKVTPGDGVTVNSKNALPLVAVLRAPVRAAAAALLPPLAPT